MRRTPPSPERRDKNPRATFSRTEKAKEPPRRLRFGTSLKICTLTGKSRELSEVHKRRRIDIACAQEVKWTGGKSVEIESIEPNLW